MTNRIVENFEKFTSIDDGNGAIYGYARIYTICNFVFLILVWHFISDGMRKFGPWRILSNVRTEITTELFKYVFCNAYHYRYGAYDCISCDAGKPLAQKLFKLFLIVYYFFLFHTRNNFIQKKAPISPEVYCNLASIIVVWVSLIPSFNEHLIKRQTWIPNFGSIVTVIGLVMLDIIVPLYHSIWTHVKPPLRPSYDAYIIFAIYIYLPLPENLHSTILAVSTTICYLMVTYVMTYRLDDHAVIKVIGKLVFSMDFQSFLWI